MEANDTARLTAVLEQIRDNQTAALAMQKEQFELVRPLAIVLPIVFLLILYLSWPLFR